MIIPLDSKYSNALNNIKKAILSSEIFQQFLEEEDPEKYNELKDQFEPMMEDLHEKVANDDPLQLISFEQQAYDPDFQGLLLPRILGFTVLRGEVDAEYAYVRSQDQFREVLTIIAHSATFDNIRLRIGQTVQLGFAVSSDIWITSFIQEIENKRVKNFFESFRKRELRIPSTRKANYLKYQKQFSHFNYKTAIFPDNVPGLLHEFYKLKDFLIYRSDKKYNNESFYEQLKLFVESDELDNHPYYIELLLIVGSYYDLGPALNLTLQNKFIAIRKLPNFNNQFFQLYVRMQDSISINRDTELRLSKVMHKGLNDKISDYFTLTDKTHTYGFIEEDVLQSVQNFYHQHSGMSIENTAVRNMISIYLKKFIGGLSVREYSDFFEIYNTVIKYIHIFNYEKFNLFIKSISFKYTDKCFTAFTDKRAKEYQDVKKFISTNYLDLGFLSDKDLKDMFKTRRKVTASK